MPRGSGPCVVSHEDVAAQIIEETLMDTKQPVGEADREQGAQAASTTGGRPRSLRLRPLVWAPVDSTTN